MRKELWIRASLDDIEGLNLGVVTVTNREEVLVSQESLRALFEHDTSFGRHEHTWFIKYPIMRELLETEGYILIDKKEIKVANEE